MDCEAFEKKANLDVLRVEWVSVMVDTELRLIDKISMVRVKEACGSTKLILLHICSLIVDCMKQRRFEKEEPGLLSVA